MMHSWRTFWVINSSLLIAVLLTLFPLPGWLETVRPQWVALVLIYWAMALPTTVGLGTAFVYGLILDIALGSLLGQHALGLSLVSYLIIKNHQRLRVYPVVQQSVIILFILLLKDLLFLWIYGITNRAPDSIWLYFLPAVISMLMWWLVFPLMRNFRRHFIPTFIR